MGELYTADLEKLYGQKKVIFHGEGEYNEYTIYYNYYDKLMLHACSLLDGECYDDTFYKALYDNEFEEFVAPDLCGCLINNLLLNK